MKVKTEELWNGRRFSIMLIIPIPTGNSETSREFITADSWSRKVAREALDLLESNYGILRRRVRFVHH